jgi:hypothetical protein
MAGRCRWEGRREGGLKRVEIGVLGFISASEEKKRRVALVSYTFSSSFPSSSPAQT